MKAKQASPQQATQALGISAQEVRRRRDAFRRGGPARLRRALKLTQVDFWGRIGVTQSAGSRYESGRAMPRTTERLLSHIYLAAEAAPYVQLQPDAPQGNSVGKPRREERRA